MGGAWVEWRERAVAWMDARLGEVGLVRTGEVAERRVRPWGTVLRAPTGRGPVWLKIPGPGMRYEPALHMILARVVPGHVPEPLGADPAEGLLLLADGGVALTETAAGTELIDGLAAALPLYGRLQRALMPYAGELTAAGVPDLRAATLPERFEEALRVATDYAPPGHEEELRALAGLRGTVRRWSERLENARVPPSLDHNDLHAKNILVGPGERMRIADWGDAVVGHPFAGMRVTLGLLAREHGLAAGDPVIVRLRDAYLAEFTDLAPHAVLVAELELACRLAAISGALTWRRALAAVPPDEAGEYGEDPLGRLRGLTTGWLTLEP